MISIGLALQSLAGPAGSRILPTPAPQILMASQPGAVWIGTDGRIFVVPSIQERQP